MFIKYIFHKIQKYAPQMGSNIIKVTSISEKEKFEKFIKLGFVFLN